MVEFKVEWSIHWPEVNKWSHNHNTFQKLEQAQSFVAQQQLMFRRYSLDIKITKIEEILNIKTNPL